MSALYESRISGLELIGRGKVRDIYRVDADHLLIVASDRLSAFDVVLPQPIPAKGEILTRISSFWFERTRHIIPNHVTGLEVSQLVSDPVERARLGDRALVVRRLRPLPVEAIARGYIIGSGWRDYRQTGAICGIPLPAGLEQAQELPEALFTPSTKAAVGGHDENIDFDRAADLIGRDLAERVRDATLAIYRSCAAYALERGIIIADTKLEFGLDADGVLHLIDEVLTPDSSRFWPADQYRTGISPPSFDKQYVRDYLETLDWDKTPPGPELPVAIVERTAAKYREAEERLTGKAPPEDESNIG